MFFSNDEIYVKIVSAEENLPELARPEGTGCEFPIVTTHRFPPAYPGAMFAIDIRLGPRFQPAGADPI